jgi:hypothetical protein
MAAPRVGVSEGGSRVGASSCPEDDCREMADCGVGLRGRCRDLGWEDLVDDGVVGSKEMKEGPESVVRVGRCFVGICRQREIRQDVLD